MNSLQAQRLVDVARRLANLATTPPAETHLLGFLTGAVYALRRAEELGYEDTREASSTASLDAEFHEVLESLAAGETIDRAWLSGFYYNDALMRIAALNQRIDAYTGQERDLAKRVRQAVNRLKHRVDPQLTGGVRPDFREVLQAAEDLTEALEAAITGQNA